MNKEIVLKDLSDVIFECGDWRTKFKNASTRKCESNVPNVVREGKKYILFTGKPYYGFYAEYDKDNDALIILSLEFNEYNGKWHEDGRTVITRSQRVSTGRCNFSHHFDVTGTCYKKCNLPGKSTQIVRDYFGGFFKLTDRHGYYGVIFNFACPENILDIPEIYSSDCVGISEYGNENGYKINESIPNGFKNRVGMLIKTHMKDISNPKISKVFTGLDCSYLQNTENGYVLRVFLCYAKEPISNEDIDSNKKIDISICEYKRVWINSIDNVDEQNKKGYLSLIASPLMFFDKEGIENGIFKYTQNLLKNMSNRAKKICNSSMNNTENSFLTIYMATKITIIEKLLNCPYKNLNKSFRYSLFLTSMPNKEWVESLFGKINWDKEPLHQMIGISRYMLKKMDEYNYSRIYLIRELKKIFESCPQFLANMNNKDVDTMFSTIRKKYPDLGIPDDVKNELRILIKLHGPHNFASYFKYITTKHVHDSLYEEYLERLESIGEIAKDVSWKLEGKSLRRTFDSLEPAYYLSLNSAKYDKCLELFKKNEKEWKKYEYRYGKYSILYPKLPSEIVFEGVKLNHCVKEFVEDVANRETIILFIRKNNNLSKPYFTLEIRDGKIRQCHGANNENTDEHYEIKDMLKHFCKEKGIQYSKGTKLLGR